MATVNKEVELDNAYAIIREQESCIENLGKRILERNKTVCEQEARIHELEDKLAGTAKKGKYLQTDGLKFVVRWLEDHKRDLTRCGHNLETGFIVAEAIETAKAEYKAELLNTRNA